ncbi:thioredoxin-like protein, putative [Bodo saltans]|uniref:Thioredoxin-like protein, putative n=1 Tax=Bodo saltans TaxID=75058 RepID=A0A0S4JFQ2_BODSA|nr:thioredoxin-like protein, putative [Bodo saltans]|eukprot:CUG88003.1 thioredoxin-like protein, putative [Bodo saltans]
MSGIQRYFGSATTLIRSDGTSVPISHLSNLKYVLLYFSAHWCPPCQRFTPKLITVYNELRAHRNNDVDIIFLSSDKSEEQFQEYFSTMPWLALPYDQRSVKTRLSGKFKVEEIPTLICLDCTTGAVVCKDAMEPINTHGSLEDAISAFPWVLPTIEEALRGAVITSKDGRLLTVDGLKALDHFAVYFSASWCNPCKAFTPILTQAYENLKLSHPNIEIIFVSHDEDVESCNDYYAAMPWAALEYNSPRMGPIRAACEVSGIPTLTIVDAKSMKVVNLDAVMVAARDCEGARWPWVPQPRPLLTNLAFDQDKANAINEDVCFLLCLPKLDDGSEVHDDEDDEAKRGNHNDADDLSLLDEFKAVVRVFDAAAAEVDAFDEDVESCNDYYAAMPWAALEYNSPRMGPIRAACEVSGIPTLTIVDAKSMKVVNLDAVMVAARDCEGARWPWVPQPRPLLTNLAFDQDKANAINEDVCFLLCLPKLDDGSEVHDDEDDEAKRGNHNDADDLSLLDEFKAVVRVFDAAAAEVDAFRKGQSTSDELKVTFFRVISPSGRDLLQRVVGVTKVAVDDSAPYILATRMGPHKTAEVLFGECLANFERVVKFGTDVYMKAAENELK